MNSSRLGRMTSGTLDDVEEGVHQAGQGAEIGDEAVGNCRTQHMQRRGCTELTGPLSRVTSSSLLPRREGKGITRWSGRARAGEVGRRRAESREGF